MRTVSQHSKGMLALGCLALSYALFVFWPVWREAHQACYHYYDFGIYADALARLGPSDVNPYIPLRHLHIFNDHADPILWLGTWLTPWFAPGEAGILTEAAMVLGQLIPVGFLIWRGVLTPSAALLTGSLLLFNPGVLSAVHFPFHPTTWAVLPMTWLMVALCAESIGGASLALLCLFACKEEFVFVGVMLCVASCAARKQRAAWIWAAISLVWAVLVFGLRPRLLGPVSHYASTLFVGLREAPAAYMWQRLTAPGMWSRVGSWAACFIPVCVYLRLQRRRVGWTAVWMCVPLVAIRFCGMAWRHHYGACVVACCVGALYQPLRQMRVPIWVTGLTLALLMATGANSLRTGVHMMLPNGNQAPRHCPNDPVRMDAIDEGVRFLSARPDALALVGQSLAPLLSERPHTEVAEGDADVAGVAWRYVFFEASVRGRKGPAYAPESGNWIDACRSDTQARVYIDRAGVFLAESCAVQWAPGAEALLP